MYFHGELETLKLLEKVLYRQLLVETKEKLSVLCFMQYQLVFFFDKLQPIIAQFDLVLFAF